MISFSMTKTFDRTIAFIAGSGLAKGLDDILENVEHHTDIKNKYGEVLSFFIGYHGNTRVAILPRHGDSSERPDRTPAELVLQKGHEAHVWLLHKLGVEAVVGTSAVGVLDLYTPIANKGVFIVPHSYMRGIAASLHTFGKDALEVHTNMAEAYDSALRQRVIDAIEGNDLVARDKAVYIYNGGDPFETPEEISVLDKATEHFKPADRLVGMTIVPETILLNQMNIPCAYICCNVNYAQGKSEEVKPEHGQTLDVMGAVAPHLTEVVKDIIRSYD